MGKEPLKENTNVYFQARKRAAMSNDRLFSRENAAELLGISPYTLTYECTGLSLDDTTDLEQVKKDFKAAVALVYDKAKNDSLLRYNDVRPLLSEISGVKDFATFTMNSGTTNIKLAQEEYPETGDMVFTE